MRSNRPYVQIDPDVLERARQIDLLSYLRTYEPSNLVKVKGTTNVYCTAEHDSLKISNGKWYWWSRGFGGYSALDYLMKVREYGFVEAVEILTGQALADWKPPPPAPKKDEPKVLLLPPKNKDCDRVTEYLFGRGIDYSLIQECIAEGIIFEGRKYHNAVFVGKDAGGTPKYAALRSTIGSSFKGDASGSDKRYSFRLLAKEPADTVHLFEAAIDLLSYATYLKCEGKDYKSENLLSLSGVYSESRDASDFKSFCVAYMVSSRYGVDTKGFSFGKLPKEYDGMDVQAFKGELGSMRDVLGEIQSDMYKSMEKNKPPKSKEQER